jgi:hypothetical protein
MAGYSYDSQLRKEREALASVINMRKGQRELKSNRGDLFMLLLIVTSCLLSFQYQAQLTAFAKHLHAACKGQQSAPAQSAKASRTGMKQVGHKNVASLKSRCRHA